MSHTQDNGIYYFLGNITSHILHALPLYKELGGTFIVTSKNAAYKLEKNYNIKAIYKDNVPFIWKWIGKRPKRQREYLQIDGRFRHTIDFLNTNARVVIFYEVFEFSDELKLNKPKKVFLTHGNMLKNYFKMHPKRLEMIRKYDYMAAIGPYMKQEFLKTGIPSDKLVDIGIARTDDVIKKRNNHTLPESLALLGIENNKPIVSYLPTFWGDSSVEILGPKLLEKISSDYTVIFRPHPQTPMKIISKYSEVIEDKPNIFYLPEGNSNRVSLLDIMGISDVIIGDISSVMLEAVLLNIPLVFAEPDTKNNIESHSQLDEIINYSSKISEHNVALLNEILADSINRGIDESLWRKTIERDFFFADGTSTRSISDFIHSID
jgi:CDP-glycerol glycerophosphotransferase (TagB/SpsB family)